MIFLILSGILLLTINCVLGLRLYSLSGYTLKIFFYYLICMLSIQVLTFSFWIMGKNNLWISHVYLICQFNFLCVFYSLQFIGWQKKMVQISMYSCLVLLVVYYIFSPETIKKYNEFEIVVTSCLLILFCGFHFYNSLIIPTKHQYITTGLFIYICSSTIIFLSGNTINKWSIEFTYTWQFNAIMYIISQLFILKEYLEQFKERRSA